MDKSEEDSWKQVIVWIAFLLLVVVLVVLCAGEPDLLDAIIFRLMKCPA